MKSSRSESTQTRARDVSNPKTGWKKKVTKRHPPRKILSTLKKSKRDARRERRTRSVKNESQTKNTYESTGIVCTGASNSLGAMFVVVVVICNFPQKRLETEVKFLVCKLQNKNPSFFTLNSLFFLFFAPLGAQKSVVWLRYFLIFFDRSPFVAVAHMRFFGNLVFFRIFRSLLRFFFSFFIKKERKKSRARNNNT